MPSITVLDSLAATQTVQTLPAVGQVASSASLPVVIASDQSTLTLQTVAANPYTLSSAATTNATSVKGAAGSVFTVAASNVGAGGAFLKLYNLAVAPTVGTSVPVLTIPLAASGVVALDFGTLGIRFATGIAFAITNLVADADTTVIAAAQVKVMLGYL